MAATALVTNSAPHGRSAAVFIFRVWFRIKITGVAELV